MTLDNAGNTLGAARKLNLTSTMQTVTDFVGTSDLNDFYSFSVSGRSSLNLAVSGLNANADVQIIQDKNFNGVFDISSEIIAGSYLTGTSSESIKTALDAGNYLIRVFPGAGANTNYNLGVSTASFSDRVLELTNAERAKVGLSALKLNSQLNQAAQGHSQDMALRDYYSHTSLNGLRFSDRISATGYKFSAASENIAAGYVTPEEVVQGWMNSSGHKANILNANYKDIGIGHYYLANDTGAVNYNNYWTQNFGVSSQPVNTVPTALQFGLEKTGYTNTETLRITNGWVFDGNGATDINRVDFRIKRANGTFVDTADVFSTTPATWDNRWGQFNYSLNLAGLNLGTGNYSLWAVAYDKAGAVSNVAERQFNLTVPNVLPTNLQFGLEKTAYSNTETLRINNGWVFDGNGATDINRVDFRIKRANGTFVDTADVFSTTPATWDNRWGQFNYSLNLAGLNLGTGNYSLWAVAYDKAGAVSNVVERQFNLTVPNTVPTNLQFGLEKTAYTNTETLRITNGWVFDGNGATDINRVDFKIKRADGTFVDTADIVSTTPATWDNRWGQFNYSLNLAGLNLGTGNYSLWAVAYDKAGATSNVVERQFAFAVISTYNSTSGYGLINAAAAVAKAIGQNTFADVTNLGGNDWGADLVKAPEVWAKGYTGKGIVVAVLDTGVDYNHTDLKGNIWTNSREIIGNGKDDDGNGFIDDVYGWNFNGNNNNTLDTHGHGTHVAGTIAGVRNNFGVTGIAYDAKIMSVKVLGNEGGSSFSVAQGIYYAVNNGANVINMSLGSGNSPANDISDALKYASSKGVIVVMAAGNESATLPGFPGRYADKWGIAVGAVDRNNNMASFSNRAGSNLLTYVTAPGVNIYSTIPGNGYSFMNGTSMAAPHVAGVVALMLSANRSLSDSRVREIVTQSAFNGQNSAFVTKNALSTSTVNIKTSLAYSINQNTFSSTTPKIANLKTDLNTVYSFKEGNMFANPINWLQSTSFYQKIQLESAANPQTILKLDKKHLLQ